ncbi:MAG TPA: lanthionine synthetase LanC family protein, partial [Thermoanaerobaculia bacterium]|nr:lanthionine synthetase LanC family protein [Thermoanaerobaculia bacterium]
LAAALAQAEDPEGVVPRAAAARRSPPAQALLSEVIAELRPGGSFTARDVTPPTASLFFGAGGLACGLYRLALRRADAGDTGAARLLAAADLWLSQAERAAEAPEAFLNPAMDMTPEVAGTISPYHTPSGLAALRALLANAQGDASGALHATRVFTRLALGWLDEPGAAPRGTEGLDLTLGRSGVLLAAALLADVLADDAAERVRLGELSGRLLDRLWEELDLAAPLGEQPVVPNLGIAHGWAGYLYATLRWCRAFGRGAYPAGLQPRLAELAAAAEPWGRGLRWRWNGGGVSSMPGWCNGSAGFVHLWTLAHRELGEPRFAELAEGAVWNAWEGPESGGSLCCGGAGRAYALLAWSRHLGGDRRWLARAQTLADRAAIAIRATAEKADSLYKGRLGVAVLAADLEAPESAAFPFFEAEGWR